MRDLKRVNAKNPAYKMLAELGFNTFTPLKLKVYDKGGKRVREWIPFMQDLLFVESAKEDLDDVVNKCDTLQYRFIKGMGYGVPMTVPCAEMDRFIAAVGRQKAPVYYNIDEITPEMIGRRIRMVCDGALNTYEGNLLMIKGARKKRLLVQLEGILAAGVEIKDFEYIEVIPKKDKPDA